MPCRRDPYWSKSAYEPLTHSSTNAVAGTTASVMSEARILCPRPVLAPAPAGADVPRCRLTAPTGARRHRREEELR
ncbi:hypothetical protein ACFWP5_51545 [Streptomyces sp. NPDC058469]|uniref:hypothetical protein n=1 Tax=Streptomyces sp. NPDC058469 TaxID=3346514 RepID=UPI00365DC746